MADQHGGMTIDDRLSESNANWEQSWVRREALEAGGNAAAWRQLISSLVCALGGQKITYAHCRVEMLDDSGLVDVNLFTDAVLVRARITHAAPEATPEVVSLRSLRAIQVLRAPSVFGADRGIVSRRARLSLIFDHGDPVVIDNEQTYTNAVDQLLDYYPSLLTHLAES